MPRDMRVWGDFPLLQSTCHVPIGQHTPAKSSRTCHSTPRGSRPFARPSRSRQQLTHVPAKSCKRPLYTNPKATRGSLLSHQLHHNSCLLQSLLATSHMPASPTNHTLTRGGITATTASSQLSSSNHTAPRHPVHLHRPIER
ncbi:hypothetical protein Scep_010658 [Stephania cephalantha]|uniref:Uncharacterized protein n=1 Tax=Stephania cephalantha TaxID=152367 RepID=A0AAP0PEE2_9MAGN